MYGAFCVTWYQKMDFLGRHDSDFDDLWYNLRSIRADLKNHMKPYIDGLLFGLGFKLDDTDLEKAQHYETFLSNLIIIMAKGKKLIRMRVTQSFSIENRVLS